MEFDQLTSSIAQLCRLDL
uniref:Uncharacterized protein n=1 Tax=Arundo donax TaxID=35708 RepID=A0A0A9CPD2_ARUDO